MLDPVNGQARIAAALMARGVPAAALPQVIPQVIGYGCLPWANPMHVARRDAAGNFIGGETHPSREDNEWSGTVKAPYRRHERFVTSFSAPRGHQGGRLNPEPVQPSNTPTHGAPVPPP